MARPHPAVDFGSADGPADLIFFIAAPDGADQEHNFAMFVVAIAVGTVVSALIVIALKRWAVRKSAPVHESAAVPVAA